MLLTFHFLTKLFEQDAYSLPPAACKTISATHMHSARQCIRSQSSLTCTKAHEDTAQFWSDCCTQGSTGNNYSLP